MAACSSCSERCDRLHAGQRGIEVDPMTVLPFELVVLRRPTKQAARWVLGTSPGMTLLGARSSPSLARPRTACWRECGRKGGHLGFHQVTEHAAQSAPGQASPGISSANVGDLREAVARDRNWPGRSRYGAILARFIPAPSRGRILSAAL